MGVRAVGVIAGLVVLCGEQILEEEAATEAGAQLLCGLVAQLGAAAEEGRVRGGVTAVVAQHLPREMTGDQPRCWRDAVRESRGSNTPGSR